MTNKKERQEIAQLEYFFGKYFDAHIAPVADKAVKDADATFLKEYDKMVKDSGVLGGLNLGGTMSSTTIGKMHTLDSYQNYWSNIQKSFQKRFDASPEFRNDLGNLINVYQKTMISCMGKEKYQAESKKYGQDFATWYVNNKLLEKSLNRMASHGAPKDAVEYLFQKGTQLSLLGLGQPSDWEGMRMLQEKQYQPSKTEKAAAYGVAGLMDFAIMPVGGMKTAVVATAASAGVDVVFSNNGSQESVDTMASKSLFGNGYMLSETRKTVVDANESPFLAGLNNGMRKKVKMVSPSPLVKEALKGNEYPWFSVDNKTNIRFDIDELRVKLTDKKVQKATNNQSIELPLALVLDHGKSFLHGYRNVIVIKKMTFPNDKVVTIELSEKQISGRTISISVDYEDVLSADAFDAVLLQEE